MIDSVQVILLLVIIVLTVLLVVLGIQVFFILKDVRVTLRKANKVLENAGSITENIEGPLAAVSSLVLGVKATSFMTIARLIKSLLGRDGDEKRNH